MFVSFAFTFIGAQCILYAHLQVNDPDVPLLERLLLLKNKTLDYYSGFQLPSHCSMLASNYFQVKTLLSKLFPGSVDVFDPGSIAWNVAHDVLDRYSFLD